MNERAALTVRWKLAGRCVLQTFNDGLFRVSRRSSKKAEGNPNSFPRSIVSDNESQGSVELNGFASYVVKGANTRLNGLALSSRAVLQQRTQGLIAYLF